MPVKPLASVRDPATRERLLRAGAFLFAERGYKAVTVREICRSARANVAAVNYHFQSKLGLYKEVVRRVADQMETSKTDLVPEDLRLSPEDRLRAYVRSFLGRLLANRSENWMDRILGREMTDPSPALDLIIERGIKPNAERLGALVAELLGRPFPDDVVWRCALSIQAQCLFYYTSRPVFSRMSRGLKFTPEVIEGLASHIAEFSLAGINHIKRRTIESKE
jgi:TetR/AcrR family transcriptional regulator, regulator of cefoperazone and chloramphenicol sensitivity